MKNSFLQTDMRAPPPEDALDFILYEHLRHREMCEALDALAEAPEIDIADAARMGEFIRVELAMHVLDEEEDFFPLLRRRCEPEDKIEEALDRFGHEHHADLELCERVLIILQTAVSENTPPSQITGARATLRAFAQGQRRHMMLENAVLIPLARRRFGKEDIAALGERLAARRLVTALVQSS